MNLLVVVFHVDFVAGIEFALVEHAVLFEEGDVFFLGECLEGFHGGAGIRETSLSSFFNPFVGIAVAVEDNALVFLNDLLEKVLEFFVELVCRNVSKLVCNDVECFCNNRIEDNVRFRATLARTRCTEFELVACECERRSTVTVRSVTRERRESIRTELESASLLAGLRIALFELVDDVSKLVAEVHGDYCRRSFVCAKAVVITSACDCHTEQVSVSIDSVNHSAERSKEDSVLVRVLTWVQEVGLTVVHRPVVVLTRTVDTCKRLFVEEADESVTVSNLTEDFHNLHVVVASEVHFFEHRSKFELSRSDFVVAGLSRNAELPEFLFHIVHEVQNARRNATEVVVFHLLVLSRSCTEQGAASLVEVRALEVETLVDEEVFLFGTERNSDLLLGNTEEAHEAVGGFLQSLDRTEKRSLLVESFTSVATECSRDAERCAVAVTLDESRGSRVPSGVTTSFESRTETTARERRCVRFADDQVLAAESENSLVAFGFQERVVLFGSGTGKRLEPVSKVSSAAIKGPLFHAVCNFASDARVERCAVIDSCKKLFADVFRQVSAHGVGVENVFTIKVDVCGGCGHVCACGFARDFLDCF